MKPILHIADLHARDPWLNWLVSESRSGNWGAIVIAGDLLDTFAPLSAMRGQIKRVCEYLAQIPAEIPLLICTGNHDFVFGKTGNSATWLRSFAKKRPRTYIDGQIAMLYGKSFEVVGWGQSPRTAADFYVIHNPPDCAKTAVSGDSNWGDILLCEHLAVHGGIALSGHVHEPASWFDSLPATKSFNPAIGGLHRNPSEPPAFISLDLARGIATRAGHPVRF